MPPRLELSGITKRFPGVVANDGVGFSVAAGEIHALLGENGAGKSTLVKIIYGVQQADEGELRWNGAPVSIESPRAARRLGIAMVFQHFSLFEAMTVLENIALGMDDPPPQRELEAAVRAVLDTYDLGLDPHRDVFTLSVGERQRIEIVRALLQNPKLLIMDEPTSVLTPQEVEQLFATLRRIAAEGCSILYISHKLGEIQALCESATILRGGKVVATCDPRSETARSMAEMMIGGSLKDVARRDGAPVGPVRLAVDGLSAPGEPPFGTTLKDVGFSVRGGEIFGIAGVAGNGQNELLLALSGERLEEVTGDIRIDETCVCGLGVSARRRRGLAAVPEERNGHAAVPALSLSENAILSARTRKRLAAGGLLRLGAAKAYASGVIEAFSVRATGAAAKARSLSGGNLQKFVMGREILQDPAVLVVSQPTWGVDAGAAGFIRQAMLDLAARGAAIVVISQDLDELFELADRIAVINDGHLSPARPLAEVTVDEIGLLMGGIHGAAPRPATSERAA
ncbi:ABC transporter ATP-binding protein [Mangrovibrevibacter kandeliae]|uniref:ABC transporter ATP-binding protein n=1 Tax=Mangrovibrevibacter kandeliae TaxID=2968473 RepID=UPI002117FE7A|nr:MULTISPECIES: ABC transporter ATP-binding protein [unclassified Aurantimonas]MCQ8783207.1 ABC transporter ATP-binding protein [Aurantimonas sp. CSK15Z-1]MCW4115545.1 ABC transporter ATP-binding protein [Aurantimonas sp. MSK8Z-1]